MPQVVIVVVLEEHTLLVELSRSAGQADLVGDLFSKKEVQRYFPAYSQAHYVDGDENPLAQTLAIDFATTLAQTLANDFATLARTCQTL